MRNQRIGAIIILYNPRWDELSANIKAVTGQVDVLVLVDNSSQRMDDSFWSSINDTEHKITYIFNNENLGVAKAQNIGITEAIKIGADFLLILDQDSKPDPDMALHLYNDYQLLIGKSIKLGVIGPVPVNKQTNKAYEPRIKKKRTFEEAPHVLHVTELISSGSLTHKDTFQEVGLMDETLFIDGVDHEWCWRAKTKGFVCALSSKAKLVHMLGEGDKKILGIRIAITSPFRVYYQYRNFLYLCRRNYVPLYWKYNNLIKYTIKLFYYPLFQTPGKVYFSNMLRGIRDGIKQPTKMRRLVVCLLLTGFHSFCLNSCHISLPF